MGDIKANGEAHFGDAGDGFDWSFRPVISPWSGARSDHDPLRCCCKRDGKKPGSCSGHCGVGSISGPSHHHVLKRLKKLLHPQTVR